MRCYRCNSVLTETDRCESCGADVSTYKKIVKMSNTYYNMGLAKARVRDLSGAADLLRRSVRIDKNNINARNLLGLVYFEMGECVEALSEWVISKNIKPEKNLADDYIKDIQSSPNRLNAINQTIVKFNKSLGYAWEGSDDLAIIQLKKVISTNPNFVKAYLLLSLLQLKKGDYNKARKNLNKVLKIDVNNTLAIKYLEEAHMSMAEEGGKKLFKEEKEEKPLSGNDVIIPKSSYRDTNYALSTFLNVLIGILIGAAMIYFLVTPAKENNAAEEYKSTITDYASKLDKSNAQITSLESEISNLTKERDTYKKKAESADKIVSSSENTEKIIKIATEAMAMKRESDGSLSEEDSVKLADELLELKKVNKENDDFKDLYKSLTDICFVKAGQHYYNIGSQYSNSNEWDDAVEAYKKCVAINDEEPAYLYKLGKALYKQNGNKNTDESIKYFKKVIEIAPNSEQAGYASNYMG